MGGKRISEGGKSVSEKAMSTAALSEAKEWADRLLDAECRGRKDREGPIRYRLAKRIGISESYLFRLVYKSDEMTDVRGSVYRALMIAHRAYEEACERNDEAAAAMRAERLNLKAGRHAVDQKRAEPGSGMGSARD